MISLKLKLGNIIHSDDQNEEEPPAKVADEAFKKIKAAAKLLEKKEKPGPARLSTSSKTSS